MLSAKRLWWCLALGVSSLSFAQAPAPVVMPLPLEVKRTPPATTKAEVDMIHQEFKRLLRKAGVALPDFAKFDAALKDFNVTDCEREDKCLVELARRADSLYALHASLDFSLEGTVVAAGRVVRNDGKAVRLTQTVRLAKGKDSFLDVARNAFTQLFAALRVADLDPVKPVEAKVDPVVIQPPPPPPPLVIEDPGAGQRAAGKSLLIGGASVVVVAGVLAGVGAGLGYSAEHSGDIASNPAMARQAATGQTLATVGFVGLGAGFLAAGVGALLWGSAGPPPAQVSVVPVLGGGVLQVGGSF